MKKEKLSKKALVTVIAIIAIIAVVVCIIIITINNSKILTAENVIKVLEQDGRTEYLQKDSIKIGASIDYTYDKYNQIVCYSCIYKGDITLKHGSLMLVNNDTKEYKNIVTDTYISALIFSQISSNNTNAQKETMKLIGNYFSENGVDNFNYGNKDNLDRYMELGKEIGKVIGIKECRTIIDKALHDNDSQLEKFTFFYNKESIFPCYVATETTDKEFVWSKYGITESVIKLLDRSAYNSMVYTYGEPYQYVTKFTIIDWNDGRKVIGKYKDKEKAKEKLDIEEANDTPSNNNENISENDTNTTNNIETNTTTNSSTQNTSKSTIKDGTYFKKLTSTEKEEGIVSLGDIKIVIKDKNIEFYDNSSQIALQGIYTIENNKIVGTYTTATYYSYDKLENVTETIEDRFEFEIKENNTLYDTMGYGQFLGKCLQRNATYEIVE